MVLEVVQLKDDIAFTYYNGFSITAKLEKQLNGAYSSVVVPETRDSKRKVRHYTQAKALTADD